MHWSRIFTQTAAAGLALCLAGMLATGAGLAAEDKAPTPAAKAEAEQKKAKDQQSVKMGEVVVSDRPASQVVGETFTGIDATSGSILSNALITDRVYVTPLDILKLVPGVNVLNFKSGGLPMGAQMRGFPWVSHSSDAAIYLDGVDLYDVCADTNPIIPEEVERVEVIKGPASALYGNHASAGSIHFHTYQSGDFTRLKLRYGSYDTMDGVAVVARKDGKLDQVYAGEVYHSDNYRQNSKWDKQIGAARWTYHATDRLTASFGARAYNSTWDEPGSIPEAWYKSDPQRALNDVNGGWRRRGQAQGALEYKLGEHSKLKWLAFGNNQEFGRWVQPYNSKVLKPGDTNGYTYLYDTQAVGSTLTYSYLGKLWGRETRLVLGVDWRRDHQHIENWYLMEGYGRTKGKQYKDDRLYFFTTSAYGELNYQILKQVRLVLGSRYDMFSGSLDQIDGKSYDNDGPRIYSPKLGLIYSPFSFLDLYANYGKGFALPSMADYSVRSYLEPAIRTQYEVGLRYRPTSWSDLSLAFWRLDTTDDFQTSMSDPNIQVNAGETRRQGIELQASAQLWRHLKLRLDYAYTTTPPSI